MAGINAREFFGRVRAASADAARCKMVLDNLEEIATRVGGSTFDAHIRGSNKDRLERSAIKCAEVEGRLHARIERDYQIIDFANAVLYGSPQCDGVADIVPRKWWADAVYHYFLGLRNWKGVNVLVGHSNSNRAAQRALDVCDQYNLIAMHARHHDPNGWVMSV